MALIRWNPTHDLLPIPSDMLSMQREINRMFDSLFRGSLADTEELTAWSPSVDVAERENDLVVKVELPGVSKDEVKITLQDNMLSIRGEKKQEKEAKDANFHRVERTYGSFQRTFTLPAPVKADKVDASYKDGILTITLPKAEEAKAKQIEVRVK